MIERGEAGVMKILATPEPAAGELLVRIGHPRLPREAPLDEIPRRPGHQLSGVAEALGPKAKDFAVGDRVTIMPQGVSHLPLGRHGGEPLQGEVGTGDVLSKGNACCVILTGYTKAEVDVESSIPPSSGPGGLWSRYDPRKLELDYFLAHPETAWPNRAHEVLAAWENEG